MSHVKGYNYPVKKKNLGGRPRMKNGARLMMTIKYSRQQRESWKRKAERAGLPVGTWMKKLADEAP